MSNKYRSAASYVSKDPVKRANSLANLRQNRQSGQVHFFEGGGQNTSINIRDTESIIEFAEKYCYLKERDEDGNRKLVKLFDWQKKIFTDLFETENDYQIAMIGCPKKSGKTEQSAIVALFYLLCKRDQEIFILGSKKDQGIFILFERIVAMIRRNPTMASQCRILEDTIKGEVSGSTLRVLSCSSAEAGINPDLILVDELHTFITPEKIKAFNELSNNIPNKKCLIWITSYAGYSDTAEGSPLWELYKKGEAGKTEGLYYIWRKNYEGCGFGDAAWLERQRKLSGSESNFRRLFYNEWVASDTAFISDEIINKNIRTGLSRGALSLEPVYIGADIGIRQDHTAIAVIGKGAEKGELALLNHRVFKPAPGCPVRVDEVVEYISSLRARYSIAELCFDPMQFEQGSQQLQSLGMRIYRFIQNQENLIIASNRLQTLLLEGHFNLYDDDEVKYYFKNTNIRETPRGGRLVKGAGVSRKIDLTIAVAMAASRAYERYVLPRRMVKAIKSPYCRA
jgi:phage terminase large subunit-like protein